MDFRLKIFRFDPRKDEKPYYQTFSVQANPTDRLLDCLTRIRWEQDPTLSYRWSCGHGICGSDGMKINGVCGVPCQKLVKDYPEAVIEPIIMGLQNRNFSYYPANVPNKEKVIQESAAMRAKLRGEAVAALG